MLNFNEQLTRTLQGNYSDYDILREKPFVIQKGEYHIMFPPCKFFELPDFLNDTYGLLTKWSSFFDELELLNYQQIHDDTQLAVYIEKLRLYNVKALKKQTVNDIAKYVQTWGKVYSKGKEVSFRKSILKEFTFDELVVAFAALVVYNEEIPKKKVQKILEKIKQATGQVNYTGTTSKGDSLYPKWADIPLSKSS